MPTCLNELDRLDPLYDVAFCSAHGQLFPATSAPSWADTAPAPKLSDATSTPAASAVTIGHTAVRSLAPIGRASTAPFAMDPADAPFRPPPAKSSVPSCSAVERRRLSE